MNRAIFHILFLLLFFSSFDAFSQNDTLKHSVFYLEFGGAGGIASLNVEHNSFEKEKINIGARFGIGTTGFRNFENELQPDFYIPFGIFANFKVIDRPNKLLIHAGAGLIYASTVHVDENYEAAREIKLNSYFQLGASYIFSQKIVLRLSYNPIISRGYGYAHWLGLSIGHTF